MVAHAPGLCRWRQDRSTRSEVKFSLAIRNFVSKNKQPSFQKQKRQKDEEAEERGEAEEKGRGNGK